MDGRQARGRVLAQAQGDRIREVAPGLWYVPSSKGGGYLVSGETCSCPDAVQGERRCKHVVAVEIVRSSPRAEFKGELAPVAPPKPPAPPRGDLTAAEQANVRAALKFVRSRTDGGWPAVARGTRFAVKSLTNVAYGGLVTASVAVRLARFVGAPVDDVIQGRYPPCCPTCGQRTMA